MFFLDYLIIRFLIVNLLSESLYHLNLPFSKREEVATLNYFLPLKYKGSTRGTRGREFERSISLRVLSIS